MTNAALLLSIIIIWPILAIMIHLVLPEPAKKIRSLSQNILLFIWLSLTILTLIIYQYPTAIMIGNWPAPFGIALVIDQLSVVMLVTFAIVSFCISVYSQQDQSIGDKSRFFYVGFWLLLLGICGALFTTDLFNLYVWLEVMLVSAFILLSVTNSIKLHAILHYAIMSIIGTLLMLLAVALLYGAFGSLSYATIAEQLANPHSIWVLPILCLLLFAISMKSAVFPLYFWLPKAYPKTSSSSTMLLSSMITKVMMVVLLRLVWMWAPLQYSFIYNSLWIAALATMLFGVLGAATQFRMKNILSFHIISQLGYILLAVILPLPFAIIAAVFFIIHNILVKTTLFMISGIIEQHYGTDDLKKLGYLIKDHKWLAIAFFLTATSLAGFPPLSGFWGKLYIIKSTLALQLYFTTAMAIFVSLFTLYSMLKIWRYVFCERAENSRLNSKSLPFSLCLSVALLPLIMLAILMGIFPDQILHILKPIEIQLSHPHHYINLVLGATS